MIDQNDSEDGEEEVEESDEEETSGMNKASSGKPLTDQEAAAIFDKLTVAQSKKSYYAKKNWTEEESKLLLWAVESFCNRKGIKPQKLNKDQWVAIAGFIPGRNDS